MVFTLAATKREDGGRESEMGQKETDKSHGKIEEQADSTNLNISFLNRQQSSSFCLFMPQCCCKTHTQTAGKCPKAFTDIT